MTVHVDIINAFIEWKVNGKYLFRIKQPSLNNPSIRWVPYLFMADEGYVVSVYENLDN